MQLLLVSSIKNYEKKLRIKLLKLINLLICKK